MNDDQIQPSPPAPPEWAGEARQIELLTRALAHMPHPGNAQIDVPIPAGSRKPFAELAYRKGVRIFPELAVVETIAVGEHQMGPYAASATMPIDIATAWKMLQAKDPELYARIKAATTEEEKLALAAEIAPGAKSGIQQIMALFDDIQGGGVQPG